MFPSSFQLNNKALRLITSDVQRRHPSEFSQASARILMLNLQSDCVVKQQAIPEDSDAKRQNKGTENTGDQ